MCVHMCSVHVHMQMVGCLSINVSLMIMQIAGGGVFSKYVCGIGSEGSLQCLQFYFLLNEVHVRTYTSVDDSVWANKYMYMTLYVAFWKYHCLKL